MTTGLVWRRLVMPPVISPEAARGALLGLHGLTRQPRLVLEAHGERGAIRWRIGADNQSTLGRACQELVTHIPGLVALPTAPNDTAPLATPAVAVRLRTPRSRWLPLTRRDLDSVTRGVVAALARPRGAEAIRYQLILGARTHPRRPPERIEPPKRDLETRHRQPGIACSVRVAAHAADRERATSLVRGFGPALKGLDAAGIRLRWYRATVGSVVHARSPLLWPLWLSLDDAVPLLGWPVSSDPRADLPGIGPRHPRRLPATAAHPRKGSVFGHAPLAANNTPRPVGQAMRDAVRHRHIMGPTGVGKSTLLGNLALQDIEAGRGVVVIDPKSDLVTDLLARIPDQRQGDVIVLDPASDRPVGLNPLAAQDPELAADGIVAVFHSLYGDGLGPRSTDILHAAVLTLARRGDGSLPMVPLLLTNPGFRRSLIGRVTVADPLGLGAFWAGFEALSGPERDAAIRPLLNKLRPIMLRPSLRAIFGQRHPAITLDEVLAQRKILLVRLGKDRIGSEAATLLGSLLVAQLWQAILSRTSLPPKQRHPVMVTIDEVQDYLRLPGSLGDALAQARGLRVGIAAAHQYRGQLGRLSDDIDANTATKCFFNLAPADARFVASTMTSGTLEADDFTSLPAYQAYLRPLVAGSPAPWVSIRTLPLPPPVRSAGALQRRSEATYGRALDEVERDLLALVEPGKSQTPQREEGPVTQPAFGRRRPSDTPAADAPTQSATPPEAPHAPDSSPTKPPDRRERRQP